MIIYVYPDKLVYDALKRKLDSIGKGQNMEEAMRRAINEVAPEAREHLYSATKRKYTVKRSAFKKSDIKIKKATKNRPVAVLQVKGPSMKIRDAYKNRKNGKRKAAQTQILKDGAMKPLELKANGKTYKAFLATMESGHTGIFQRMPKKYMKVYSTSGWRKGREAIRELVSISRATAAGKAYDVNVAEDIQEDLRIRMLKHINSVLGE